MKALRVLIVDDEPLAVRRLRIALATCEDVEVVGAAAEAGAALELIGALAPDVVLLDIRMPGLSGLEMARAIDPAAAPAFVFVTAFAGYAPEAFDLAAADYLLKPVEFERLRLALDRARRKLQTRTAEERIAELESLVRALAGGEAQAPAYETELWAPDRGGKRVRLPVEAICWIEAEREYVRVHTDERSFLIRGSLRDLQARLDPAEFVRVHRGAMVRRSRIACVARRKGGPTLLVLASGVEVPVARRFGPRLRELTGGG